MSRRHQWKMLPGQELDAGMNMSDKLDDGALLTGTPTGAIRSKSGSSYTDAATGGVSGLQRNTGAGTDVNGDTFAANQGVLFRITAPTTPGTYYIRIDCAQDSGADPASKEGVLVVDGSPVTS